MAAVIKRIFGRYSRIHKKCLGCGAELNATLKDDTVYTCEDCGQQHFVDVYERSIALTVIERSDVRKRHKGHLLPEQKQARETLIERVETREN